VNRHQLTYSSCGGCSRVGGRFDGADVAAYEHGHVAGPDVFLADERDVGGFHHRVGRFDRADEAFGFDESECVLRHE
jgi:hypothetical protein